MRHAVEDVAFLADPTSGELRLGCVDWQAASVGLAIDRMSRRYPRITFDVMSANAATLHRELKGRNIELYVAMRPDSLGEDDFEAEVLYDNDPLVVAADVRHPLVRRRSIELAELMSEAWVLPPKDTIAASYIRDVFQESGLAPANTVVRTYSSVLQHHLLATARFVIFLPNSMLQVIATSHSLKALPVELPKRVRQIAIVVLKKRMLSPIAQLFIETLCDLARPPTKAKIKRTLILPQ